ncbi:MAG: TetR/AcrR family transcriptional regulator [Lewinellaceae bacterium]|nr:TetR/AcrR family transcriptional regulator [Lewinellaceae bacterium]
MKTRERIWKTALTLFNERGFANVSMRDIAADLGMSPGNLSYHFPNQESLVAEHFRQLALLNEETLTINVGPEFCMVDFLRHYRQVYENQFAFRYLLLNLVPLLDSYPLIREEYLQRQQSRRDVIFHRILALAANQQLALKGDLDTIHRLVGQVAIQARFWLSDAHLSFPGKPGRELIQYYLRLLSEIFFPYLPEEVVRQSEAFFLSSSQA